MPFDVWAARALHRWPCQFIVAFVEVVPERFRPVEFRFSLAELELPLLEPAFSNFRRPSSDFRRPSLPELLHYRARVFVARALLSWDDTKLIHPSAAQSNALSVVARPIASPASGACIVVNSVAHERMPYEPGKAHGQRTCFGMTAGYHRLDFCGALCCMMLSSHAHILSRRGLQRPCKLCVDAVASIGTRRVGVCSAPVSCEIVQD